MQERRADDILHRPLIVEMEGVGGDRVAEILRDGVYIGILAVEKSIGPDRYFVSESEEIEFSVQRSGVTGDSEVRDGVEILDDAIIPEIVIDRIGDAEQIAHGILVKGANLDVPVVVDLMLDLDETGIGDEVRARAGLPVTDPGRIDGGRQHRKFWS